MTSSEQQRFIAEGERVERIRVEGDTLKYDQLYGFVLQSTALLDAILTPGYFDPALEYGLKNYARHHPVIRFTLKNGDEVTCGEVVLTAIFPATATQ